MRTAMIAGAALAGSVLFGLLASPAHADPVGDVVVDTLAEVALVPDVVTVPEVVPEVAAAEVAVTEVVPEVAVTEVVPEVAVTEVVPEVTVTEAVPGPVDLTPAVPEASIPTVPATTPPVAETLPLVELPLVELPAVGTVEDATRPVTDTVASIGTLDLGEAVTSTVARAESQAVATVAELVGPELVGHLPVPAVSPLVEPVGQAVDQVVEDATEVVGSTVDQIVAGAPPLPAEQPSPDRVVPGLPDPGLVVPLLPAPVESVSALIDLPQLPATDLPAKPVATLATAASVPAPSILVGATRTGPEQESGGAAVLALLSFLGPADSPPYPPTPSAVVSATSGSTPDQDSPARAPIRPGPVPGGHSQAGNPNDNGPPMLWATPPAVPADADPARLRLFEGVTGSGLVMSVLSPPG